MRMDRLSYVSRMSSISLFLLTTKSSGQVSIMGATKGISMLCRKPLVGLSGISTILLDICANRGKIWALDYVNFEVFDRAGYPQLTTILSYRDTASGAYDV